ncbi:MAG TPA: arginine deiminase family protein, partial [Nocardioides sp.]|nr:arginine deiminase family protein [Nocardioides sp.]
METQVPGGAQPVREGHGADSEVGRLHTVMLHRPGHELKRLTPRNNDKLLFDGIPWVNRAQEEHDAFAEALRSRGVEVLYLTDLLTEALQQDQARNHAITTALSGLHLGDTMRSYLARVLQDAPPEELTGYLTAGIRNDEVRGG